MSVPTNHCVALPKASAYIGTSGRPLLTAVQVAAPVAGTVPRHTCCARPKPLNATSMVLASPGRLCTSQIHWPAGSSGACSARAVQAPLPARSSRYTCPVVVAQ